MNSHYATPATQDWSESSDLDPRHDYNDWKEYLKYYAGPFEPYDWRDCDSRLEDLTKQAPWVDLPEINRKWC